MRLLDADSTLGVQGLLQVWGGGSFGAGERVASDGWKPDVARV